MQRGDSMEKNRTAYAIAQTISGQDIKCLRKKSRFASDTDGEYTAGEKERVDKRCKVMMWIISDFFQGTH